MILNLEVFGYRSLKSAMSLFRYNPPDYFRTSPMERFVANLLDNAFDDGLSRPLRAVAPYWLHQPVLNECNIGSAVGEVTFCLLFDGF